MKKKRKRYNGTTKQNKYKKSKKATTKRELFPFNSFSLDSNLRGWWFSSDETLKNDERSETLFSSKSLTSDSSEPCQRRWYHWSDTDLRHCRGGSKVGLVLMDGRVRDSFAGMKKSSDPHNDFKASIVEMIVEK